MLPWTVPLMEADSTTSALTLLRLSQPIEVVMVLSQPVLDGGGSGVRLITATSRNFVTVNDLARKHMDVAGSDHGDYAAHFENCSDLTVTNNRVQPYCWRGIHLIGYDGLTHSNITVQNNDISDVSVEISVATAIQGTLTRMALS